jgi:hypothetical protein
MTTIKLTDKHLRVIELALEVYCRMKLGQFTYAIEEAFGYICSVDDKELLEDVHVNLRRILFKDVEFMQKSQHASYGITNEAVGDGREAYEIRQVIRQYRTVKQNDGFFDPRFTSNDDPLKVSGEPLPIIEGWNKDHRMPIECKKTNKMLKKLVDAKQFTMAWTLVDEYKSKHPFYNCVRYSEGEIALRDDGVYEIIMTKPYKYNTNSLQ